MNEIIFPATWTNKTYQDFVNTLRKLRDIKYLEFNKKIVFTNYEMFGIRVPLLRKIAKQIKNTDILQFLDISKPTTYEEIFIRGIIISYIKDYSIFLNYFNDYLQYIDNWAICDMVISSFKIIKTNKENFENIIKNLLKSKEEYYVRVGIISLMDYYISKEKLEDLFAYLNNITHDSYYVHMAIAWMVSIMYIKFPKETELYLKNNNLKDITHNKAIQKIRESLRVSKETKDYLLKYKR